VTASFALQIQATVLAQGRSRLNAVVVALSGVVSLFSYWLFVEPGSVQSAVHALLAGFAGTLVLWIVVAAATGTQWYAGRSALHEGLIAAKALTPYVVIALAPAVVGTAAVIAVREIVSSHVGAQAAGLWQGLFRVSDAVMAMVQAVVSFVLLPEVFRSGNPHRALKARLAGYGMLVAAGFAIGVVILWHGSDLIVRILYSKQYAAISPLLWIELLGDTLKALAMPFIAFFIYQKNLRFSWALELIFSITFVVATYRLTSTAGLTGAAIGYAIANSILLMAAIAMFVGTPDV
jgi:O-antigen/teichoic acid export membrane protein